MVLPKRKQIRLKDFDYSQPNLYFLTICTHNRARLFAQKDGPHIENTKNNDIDNPDLIIDKWISELENKYENLLVDLYVVMPDHIHLIIYNPGVIDASGNHTGKKLNEIIKWFKTQTTNEYLRGVKRGIYLPYKEHLWQRNYYEHIIRNHEDYQETCKYIYENPQKWYYENK